MERDRFRLLLMPSPPGAPKVVEVGAEFMTIEWSAPEHGGGDVFKYVRTACPGEKLRIGRVSLSFLLPSRCAGLRAAPPPHRTRAPSRVIATALRPCRAQV